MKTGKETTETMQLVENDDHHHHHHRKQSKHEQKQRKCSNLEKTATTSNNKTMETGTETKEMKQHRENSDNNKIMRRAWRKGGVTA